MAILTWTLKKLSKSPTDLLLHVKSSLLHVTVMSCNMSYEKAKYAISSLQKPTKILIKLLFENVHFTNRAVIFLSGWPSAAGPSFSSWLRGTGCRSWSCPTARKCRVEGRISAGQRTTQTTEKRNYLQHRKCWSGVVKVQHLKMWL